MHRQTTELFHHVTTVILETMETVNALPVLDIDMLNSEKQYILLGI